MLTQKKTLDFLHSKKLCHNALKLDSIYVTESGKRWVLGGMEFLKSSDEIDEAFIQTLYKFIPENIRAPEDTDMELVGFLNVFLVFQSSLNCCHITIWFFNT